MNNPNLQRIIANFQKKFKTAQREREKRRVIKQITRRQQDAYKDAQDAKAGRSRAMFLLNFKRNIALRRAAFQKALRWDTLLQALHSARAAARTPRALLYVFRAVCVIALVAIVGDVVMYSRWSSGRPLVTVGGRKITKREYLTNLDIVAGKPVLNKLVFGELIRQAADKAHLTPTARDIDARLAEQRRQRPDLVPAQDTPALRDQVGQKIALENLQTQGITVTDAEVGAYYAAHQGEFSRPSQAQVTLVVAQNPVDALEATRLLTQDLPEEAVAARHGLHVDGVSGFRVNMNALPPNIHAQLSQNVLQMKDGEIKTFRLGGAFLVFKMKTHMFGSTLPLSQVREQVTREVKMQKAPSEQQELVALYKANKPYFDMSNYSQYFSDVETAPSSAKSGAPAKTANLPR